MNMAKWIVPAVMAGFLCAGCESKAVTTAPERTPVAACPQVEWLTGVVERYDGGVAIGGEADPSGYILTRNRQYERLYLRMDGSMASERLAPFVGQWVVVNGTTGAVTAGGVETPRRSFAVLDVAEIHEVDSSATKSERRGTP